MPNTIQTVCRITDSQVSDDELCSIPELCDFFGITSETFRRWRVNGSFPVKPLPVPMQKKLFRLGDVRRFIRRPKTK